MTDLEAIERRHSVRAFQNRPVPADLLQKIRELTEKINRESGLHIQLVTNEPKAFSSRLAKYGRFENVTDYLMMIGKKSPDLDEKVGYYGEKLVLEIQKMGLNTCWVGLTYKKIPDVFSVKPDEKIVCAIALGYGQTNGVLHKSKPLSEISNLDETSPDWFKKGIQAAALAPTAVNQQAFRFTYQNGKVKAETKLRPYGKVDLGIAKAHFEIGSQKGPEIFSE